MTPPTMVFGREKSFRLPPFFAALGTAAGRKLFPIHEDFFPGPGSRTKYQYDAGSLIMATTSGTYHDAADTAKNAPRTHHALAAVLRRLLVRRVRPPGRHGRSTASRPDPRRHAPPPARTR